MNYLVETCGTAIKTVAAAIALSMMLCALGVGMLASGIVGVMGRLTD